MNILHLQQNAYGTNKLVLFFIQILSSEMKENFLIE